MLYKTERIENLDELEAIHRNLYTDSWNLRAELEKDIPNMEYVKTLVKSLHMESHKALDFEFILSQRTVEDSTPLSQMKDALKESLPLPVRQSATHLHLSISPELSALLLSPIRKDSSSS